MKLPNRNKARKDERRVSAAERQAFHAALTTEQKLASLDQRLGKGVGAVRERARLLKLAQAGVKPVAKQTAEAVFGVAETKKELTKKGQGRRGAQHPKP